MNLKNSNENTGAEVQEIAPAVGQTATAPSDDKYIAPIDAPFTSLFTREQNVALCTQDPTGQAHIEVSRTFPGDAEDRETEDYAAAAALFLSDLAASKFYQSESPLFRSEEELSLEVTYLEGAQCAANYIRAKLTKARILNLTRANTTTPFPPPTEEDDEEREAARLRQTRAVWVHDADPTVSRFRYTVFVPWGQFRSEAEPLFFRSHAPYTPYTWAHTFRRYVNGKAFETKDVRDYYASSTFGAKFEDFLDADTKRRLHFEWCWARWGADCDVLELDDKFILTNR